MQRKINLVGSNTLTVSLPRKWVNKVHLRKGDMIDVHEEGNNLLIKTGDNSQKRTIEIDVSNLPTMTGRLIGAFYKAGFDEIIVHYDTPLRLQAIKKELTKGFIGMDITYESSKYCVVKSMAVLRFDQLDSSIRRLFYLVKDVFKSLLTAIKEKDKETLLDLPSQDANINKYADISRRLLNKYGHDSYMNTNALYDIVEQIENIGDKIREIAVIANEPDFKLSKNSLELLEASVDFFEMFYELYFTFDEKKCERFHRTADQMMKKADTLLGLCVDCRVVAKMEYIITAIFNLNGPLLTSNFLRLDMHK